MFQKTIWIKKNMKEVFEHIFKSNTDEPKSCEKQTEYVLGNSKHDYFICESKVLLDLVQKVALHQKSCDSNLSPIALEYAGHVIEAKWVCDHGHSFKWESSTHLGEYYTVNYKVMNAYLCSGMTQVQYERLAEFADFGFLSEHFRNKAAITFAAVVDVLTKESVQFALFEECQASKEKKKRELQY